MTYDANGNMTTMPRPTSLANAYTCVYDAWNRLVEAKEGITVVASHEYDGLNRRTIESPVHANTYYRHLFYNGSLGNCGQSAVARAETGTSSGRRRRNCPGNSPNDFSH